MPLDADLQRAAAVVNAGQKVVILAGQGALDARDELLALAERLGAPIVIDIDPARIGLRYPVEVGLVGDSKVTLQQLLHLLNRKDDRSFLEQAQAGMRDWWRVLEDRATRDGIPMKPQAVTHYLSPLLDVDAIVVTDSGTNTAWAARHVRIRGQQMFSCSGTLATMACELGYAIGAQVAYPHRQVVAVIGDGVIGFGDHLRGIFRLPGGIKLGLYNFVMGPPVFAPLLTCFAGILGLIAARLRPERLSDTWPDRLHVHLAPDWILDTEMREDAPQTEVDFCIVGTGGGGVLAQRLARYGFSVVALEAGQWHDSETEMVSDEAGSARLFWNDLRITGGSEPLALGANNSGRGVGGSTIHYSAFCPRLHPSDFRVLSQRLSQ